MERKAFSFFVTPPPALLLTLSRHPPQVFVAADTAVQTAAFGQPVSPPSLASLVCWLVVVRVVVVVMLGTHCCQRACHSHAHHHMHHHMPSQLSAAVAGMTELVAGLGQLALLWLLLLLQLLPSKRVGHQTYGS